MSEVQIGRVRAVAIGHVALFGGGGRTSAIQKRVVDDVVFVDTLGVAGDEQADRKVHGGVDKAVHCYSYAHYSEWRADIGDSSRLKAPPAFGENLSLDGIAEDGVYLSDRWRIGTAELEVSQGRQPCWKLNTHFCVADMASRVQRTGRTGWYLRVLRAGYIRAGDAVILTSRPHPGWSLAAIQQLIQERVTDPAVLEGVLALPLTSSWRRLFENRSRQQTVENWDARLTGQ
jgi:MOSC domain-containing protein YiiM